jgi:pimeloyl-ACP methyl ester carboxylesterase
LGASTTGEYSVVSTPILEIGYLEWNREAKHPAVLVHGWPDSPEGWVDVARRMADAGYRVLCPALRGFGPTRFRDATTPRSGQLSALGRDLLEFIDALGLEQPLLVGHDWGARATANAFGFRREAGSHLVMLSVGYGTNDPEQKITYTQARNYWYHWFMATSRG